MAAITIKQGQTATFSQSFSFAAHAAIDGGTDGGRGGTVFLTNRDTLTTSASISIGGGTGSTSTAGPSKGGQLRVTGSLTTAGLISVAGGKSDHLYGSGAGGAGGTLGIAGALTNSGTIAIAGGSIGVSLIYTAGEGGLLSNTGVLTNTGLIAVSGEYGGSYGAYNGTAGTIDNLGTLDNIGTLALQGASSSGVLINTGVLTNSGAISVAGSFGNPALLDNAGVATNTGLITVKGGGAVFGLYGSSHGGNLTNTGTFTNGGTLDVQGGAASFGQGSGVGGNLQLQAGTLTNNRLITLDGGAAGKQGFYAFYDGGGGGQLDISQAASLDNAARIIAQTGALYARGGDINIDGLLSNAGQITVYGSPAGQSGSLVIGVTGRLEAEIGGTVSLIGNFGTAAGIDNSGYISGRGVINGGGTIFNQHIIQGTFGTLAIAADITGTGQIDELGSGTLVLDGTIGSGQTLFIESGVVITGIGNAGVLVANSSSTDTGKLRFSSGGTGVLNAADSHLTVQLEQASTLTLSTLGFVTAQGSTGADTLIALAAGQTLQGGTGTDTLIGAIQTGDTFLGTAADENGDTIAGFAGTDVIDITDLLPGAGLMLAYTQGAQQGTLTLTQGAASTTITLTGSFTASQFTTSPDSHGGLLIGLH